MITLTCLAGHEFVISNFPDVNRQFLISDSNVDALVAELNELKGAGDDFVDRAGCSITDRARITYVCPTCERLMIFENGMDESYTSYTKET